MKILLPLFLLTIAFSQAADRVALVIGNDAYQHARPLNAAVNDATAVAGMLQKLGFETISASNAGLEQMIEAMELLKTKAAGAKAVLVYYAGHGVESQGANYLVPVDAKLEKEVQLQTQAVNLNGVLEKLTALNVPARMVILDCCRDNPLEGRSWLATRSAGGGGLAALPEDELQEATLVVYAASPGKPALDRVNNTDTHSPFTQALLDELPQPGVHSFEVFGRIEERVLTVTDARQKPRIFYNGSTLPFRNFRFAMGTAAPAPAVVQTPPAPNSGPAVPIVAQDQPAKLPAQGYFELRELFAATPYASYNRHSQHEILKRVQQSLKNLGQHSGAVDGSMGPATQQSILKWQASVGKPATGRLSSEALSELQLAGIAEMSPPPASSSSKTQKKTAPKSRIIRTSSGDVDISGFRSGTKVRNPHTGEIFVVP